MDHEGALQVDVHQIDRCHVLRIDLERLEERPIVHILAVPGAIVDAVEAAVEDQTRRALRMRPRGGLLDNRSVKLRDANSLRKISIHSLP